MANIAHTDYPAGRSECPFGVDSSMIELIIRPWKQLVNGVKLHIKQWTSPISARLVTGILSDARRTQGTKRESLVWDVATSGVKALPSDGLCRRLRSGLGRLWSSFSSFLLTLEIDVVRQKFVNLGQIRATL